MLGGKPVSVIATADVEISLIAQAPENIAVARAIRLLNGRRAVHVAASASAAGEDKEGQQYR
jgi:hypothetical protein